MVHSYVYNSQKKTAFVDYMVDNWTRPHLYVSCCEYMTFQTVVRAWMSVKLYLSQAGRLNVLGASLCGLIFKRDVPDDLGLEW